jgi:3-dehydroquinate dehydratase-1
MNGPRGSKIVGVLATTAALEKAVRLRFPPNFFELRLDALHRSLPQVEKTLAQLRAPLIITARHPAEGGRHGLSDAARRELLQRFLARGTFADLELRSLGELRPVVEAARRERVGLIVSCHHLDDTPLLEELERQLKAAKTSGADIFKIVTRTDTHAQVDRLLDFFSRNCGALPIAAMGAGKLGAESRRRLAQLGSALVYGSVGQPNAEGQPSLAKLRRSSRAFNR